MADQLNRKPTSAQRILAIIHDRAPKARLNHGTRHLGDTLLNDLFADPDALMAALVSSGRIVPGNPEGSPFFALVGPDGPMYRVFTDAEISVWREWTSSLDAVAPKPAPGDPSDPGGRMLELIETMRPLQDGATAHSSHKLAGPDPRDPAKTVTHPVAWWFGQPGRVLMAALADQQNGLITPGNAQDSGFVTDLVTGRNAMARALGVAMVGTGGTRADVITGWIAGCPIPAEEPDRPITLLSPPERVDAHSTGAIHGSGSVH